MDLKKTKKLWVAMIATFLIGIFALAVQPTAANTSGVDRQATILPVSIDLQTMFTFNLLTGILAGVAVVLTAFLVYLMIYRHKKIKLET